MTERTFRLVRQYDSGDAVPVSTYSYLTKDRKAIWSYCEMRNGLMAEEDRDAKRQARSSGMPAPVPRGFCFAVQELKGGEWRLM